MRVSKTISTHNPKDFSNVQLAVSAHRDIFMIHPNGGDTMIDIVTPEVIDHRVFCDELTKLGLKVIEVYIDPATGYEVTRGTIVHGGIAHRFIVRYDVLTRQHLDDVISMVKYTVPVTDPNEEY